MAAVRNLWAQGEVGETGVVIVLRIDFSLLPKWSLPSNEIPSQWLKL